MKIRSSSKDKKLGAQRKINKEENNKITMMGKIIPKATELKNGKVKNTINFDTRENPGNLFEETINKLEFYNLNQQNKVEVRTRNNLNLYAEQENELKSKAIFDFNTNQNVENKKLIYSNSSPNNNNYKDNENDENEIDNNFNSILNANENVCYNNNNNFYNENDNNNNLNSNLDGSFGFSRNSGLTSNNPHLNSHNRMISDNSNFNLNDKEVNLDKQSGISENNIFLDNFNKNNYSSRNDFSKDERILSFLFSVIDSKFSLGVFKKFNLNFYDFLNVTKDELTEFKIPVKEKIRVLKLNLNLKKYLEENINENDLTAYTQNTADVNNFNLILEFFKENKFLVYNQKFLDGFLSDFNYFTSKNKGEGEEKDLNLNNNNYNYNSNENEELNDLNAKNVCDVENNENADEDKNLESNYITTPNFRNISYRKNNNTNSTNNNSANLNNQVINNNLNRDHLSNNQLKQNYNKQSSCNDDFLFKAKTNTIFDNYNNNPNRDVVYSTNKNMNNVNNNNQKVNQHEKEIIELLKNKEIKSNTLSCEQAYSAKKAMFDEASAINKSKKNENSNYESFRNECEKIKDLNHNYKDIYSNANSFIGNKLSEFGYDPYSESSTYNKNLNQNSNLFNESGNAFSNKIKCAADNSSIKINNYEESNRDSLSLKISNFSAKSKNNLNNNLNPNLNFNYNNDQNFRMSNKNLNNQEYEYNYADQERKNDQNEKNYYSNFLDNRTAENSKNLTNKNVKGSNKENQSSGKFNKQEVLENHENLQKQKKLLDKLIENKTKSKIKFKKNSTRYLNNSNEISKVVNNYLSEFKELKQRSEDRQMKFNRLLKNCNRMQNNANINNKNNYNSNPAFNIEEENITEKTNSEDREELYLNKELNDLLNELQIYSDNFRVSDENINKLKRIKEIIDCLKAKNNNFEFDLDFNVEELEKQLELEKIEKVEQRKLKIAEEIKKCSFNINEKKKILDILEQDSVRNKNKSNELLNRIKKINSNNSFKNNLTQQSKAITLNNQSSKCSSEKTNSLNNQENYSIHNEDECDYENENLNQHSEQSSYDEYYDSKNYSIHNFQRDN